MFFVGAELHGVADWSPIVPVLPSDVVSLVVRAPAGQDALGVRQKGRNRCEECEVGDMLVHLTCPCCVLKSFREI